MIYYQTMALNNQKVQNKYLIHSMEILQNIYQKQISIAWNSANVWGTSDLTKAYPTIEF